MKGIILAGGTGTRMGIVSRAVNKHLCLVYKYPMLMYSVRDMIACHISEILIVTSERTAAQVIGLLGNGEDYGVNITYKYQREPLGIANALALGEDFSDGGPICVMLADNFCDPTPTDIVESWDRRGAHIILHTTDNPSAYGIARFDMIYSVHGFGVSVGDITETPRNHGDSEYDEPTINSFLINRTMTDIVEKPSTHIGNLMITGIYMYDSNVWDILRDLSPSARGEYEISDVNREYLSSGELQYSIYTGVWLDCGSPDLLLDASIYAREHGLEVFNE